MQRAVNIVWTENGRVRRNFGRAKDMFSRAVDMFIRANNHSQDAMANKGTGANEPDKEIQSKLLSPSLPHIHTLRTPNIITPPFVDELNLSLLDLLPPLVRILEHAPRGGMRL